MGPANRALQPLRIPAGWVVAYNSWYEADPNEPGAADWLQEDLLQVHHPGNDRLLAVGWYGPPESGEFGVVVYCGDFRGALLDEFRCRERQSVVGEVERLLRLHSGFRAKPSAASTCDDR